MDHESRYSQIQDELAGLFKDVPQEQIQLINNLIQRVVFMHVTLEDLEEDIRINGPLELTKTRPRKLRERPSVKMYNALIKNYNATIKQMMAWIPVSKTNEADDELLKFLKR